MVKSIKQGMTIDAHPHKQLMQILIDVENVCGTDLRLPPRKTYRLMVGYTIPQNIDSIKFVEHVGIVVLYLGRRTWLIREYAEKNLPRSAILRIGKHIFPDAELHFGEKLMMGVFTVTAKTIISLADNSCAVSAAWNVKYASD